MEHFSFSSSSVYDSQLFLRPTWVRKSENNDKTTKEFTLAFFIDLSKAFDTISHDILLSNLENLDIRGIANKWFASYLSERKQYMELFNIKSSSENIKCGVPPESIFGPLLF